MKIPFSLSHNILTQSMYQMNSVSAAFKIPENIVDEILANVAALNKQTWTLRIKSNGKGKIELNFLSHVVQYLTPHIREKGRRNRNGYGMYVEIYTLNETNRDENPPIITGEVSYRRILDNHDINPKDHAKEFVYLVFEDDPSTFGWICNEYNPRESDFAFDHGTFYKGSNTYKITKKIEGFRIVSNDEEEPDPDWFEHFDAYTVR